VQMKKKIAVLLMEAGVSCNKRKLHKVGLLPGTAGDQPGHRRRAETVSALVLRNGSSSREDRKCTGARSPTGSIAARPRGTAHDDSCGRSDHGTDLGTGSWRRAAIFFNHRRERTGKRECNEDEISHYSFSPHYARRAAAQRNVSVPRPTHPVRTLNVLYPTASFRKNSAN